jgi:large subunit ribosomal protein L31
MKQEIHPEYNSVAKVNCSCGNSWVTGSTKAEINVNICSACHPFYTGEQRIIDSVGRVERFVKRLESRQSAAARQQIESQAREEADVAGRRARARGDDPEEAMAEVMSRYDLEEEAEEATEAEAEEAAEEAA